MDPQAEQYAPPDGGTPLSTPGTAGEEALTMENFNRLLAAIHTRDEEMAALRHHMALMQEEMRDLKLGTEARRQQDTPPDAPRDAAL